MSETGRVEMWRAGLRPGLAVTVPFVWRCLNNMSGGGRGWGRDYNRYRDHYGYGPYGWGGPYGGYGVPYDGGFPYAAPAAPAAPAPAETK